MKETVPRLKNGKEIQPQSDLHWKGDTLSGDILVEDVVRPSVDDTAYQEAGRRETLQVAERAYEAMVHELHQLSEVAEPNIDLTNKDGRDALQNICTHQIPHFVDALETVLQHRPEHQDEANAHIAHAMAKMEGLVTILEGSTDTYPPTGTDEFAAEVMNRYHLILAELHQAADIVRGEDEMELTEGGTTAMSPISQETEAEIVIGEEHERESKPSAEVDHRQGLISDLHQKLGESITLMEELDAQDLTDQQRERHKTQAHQAAQAYHAILEQLESAETIDISLQIEVERQLLKAKSQYRAAREPIIAQEKAAQLHEEWIALQSEAQTKEDEALDFIDKMKVTSTGVVSMSLFRHAAEAIKIYKEIQAYDTNRMSIAVAKRRMRQADIFMYGVQESSNSLEDQALIAEIEGRVRECEQLMEQAYHDRRVPDEVGDEFNAAANEYRELINQIRSFERDERKLTNLLERAQTRILLTKESYNRYTASQQAA